MACLPQEIPFDLITPHGSRLAGCHLEGNSRLTGVFIHGFRSDCGGTKSLALAQYAAAKGRRWLRVDLSGHGVSSGAFRDFLLSTLLADVEAVLDRLGGPVLLVGSSMGGWLATLAALRRPQQVKALILVAPAYNFIQLNFGSLAAADLTAWQRAGWRKFASAYEPDTYELAYPVLADAQSHDLLSTPTSLACPVSIVHGEYDDAVPLDISRRFLAGLKAPDRKLTVVPNGDHRLNDAIPLMQTEIDRLWEAIEPG